MHVRRGIVPGTDIVDLCCGNGLFTAPLALPARCVVAIDLDSRCRKERVTCTGFVSTRT